MKSKVAEVAEAEKELAVLEWVLSLSLVWDMVPEGKAVVLVVMMGQIMSVVKGLGAG
jgi:hypothetical protein